MPHHLRGDAASAVCRAEERDGEEAGTGCEKAEGLLDWVVAYCLRITELDPIKYNLLFERFLNPERVTMPDIDVDFADVRRQEVIDYVSEKYGAEKVLMLC